MPTIQEEIARVKELIFGIPSENQLNEGCVWTLNQNTRKNTTVLIWQNNNFIILLKKQQSVHDRLGDNEQLEDWMESKIAQMADNIDSVSNSFDYDEHEDHHEEEVITLDLGEEIMSGLQSGYADDSESDNAYDFQSKGALGSQPELGEEGFTEPETNYSKIKKGYNFDSDGPQDSYISNPSEMESLMAFELGEQDSGTESGESDDAAGAGTASMGVWDSGIARGVANQLGNTKWSDSLSTRKG